MDPMKPEPVVFSMLAAGVALLPLAGGAAPVPDAVMRWKAQDALDPPRAGSLMFVGSSSIRRWESLAMDFAGYRVLQRGFGGSQFEEVNAHIGDIVLAAKPAAVVLWVGTNDISSGESADEVFADYRQFLRLLHAALPETQVFFIGMTRNPANMGNAERTAQRLRANALIAGHVAAAGDARLHYIDLPPRFEGLDEAALAELYVDPLHLKKAGYGAWLEVVKPAVAAVVKPDKAPVANDRTLRAGDALLVDFGPDNPEDGDRTVGPDGAGNHWNNWHSVRGGGAINAGEHLADLVDHRGRETGIRLTITGGFLCNGKRNGGLAKPSPHMAGRLAVPSATQDYFFCGADDLTEGGDDDSGGGFMLDGLDPAMRYDFRFLGSRSAAEELRVTGYRVVGATAGSAALRTTGPGTGGGDDPNGNDQRTALVPAIQPDAYGQVFVDVSLLRGSFAYLNAVEITAKTAK